MSHPTSGQVSSLPPLNSRAAPSPNPMFGNTTGSHGTRRQSRSTLASGHGSHQAGGHGGGTAGGIGGVLGSTNASQSNPNGVTGDGSAGPDGEGQGIVYGRAIPLPAELQWSQELVAAHEAYRSESDREDAFDEDDDNGEGEDEMSGSRGGDEKSDDGVVGDGDGAEQDPDSGRGKSSGRRQSQSRTRSQNRRRSSRRKSQSSREGRGGDAGSSFSVKLEKISGMKRDQVSVSARTNTEKEEAVLDAVDAFRQSFFHLFPTRPLLLLQPLNECGIPKFICTTLRPTQLPYEQLYDYATCAKFVADFITYESLLKPYEIPKYVLSPKRTLEWQVGDSIDMSLVLASLLIGVGYDAYCVLGYATKEVTLKDERKTECPALSDGQKDDNGRPDSGRKVYKFNSRPVLESKFVKMMEEKKLRAEELEKQKATMLLRKSESRDQNLRRDPFYGKRIHCWVMLFAGKRELPTNVFIESTTGACYPVEHPSYLGIETMWNHRNVWVNMQTKASSIKDLSFDLHDVSRWEHVIREASEVKKGQDILQYHDEEDRHKNDTDNGDDPEKAVDLPPPWVDKLEIPRDAFYMRCPQGQRENVYRKCKFDLYAEYRRPDGMVSQIVLYRDFKRKLPLEVRQSFANRKDRLSQRIYYILEQKTHEFFEPGRSHGVKEHIYIEGKRRTMHFYSSARVDGLVSRDDLIGKKIVETYTGRDDRLVYRSITYFDKSEVGKRDELIPRKMTEKFSRNEALPADEDIAKRTFDLDEKNGGIRLVFHKLPGRITASTRFHPKSGEAEIFFVDQFSKKPKKTALHEEFARLLIAEKDCTTAIRESERDAKEILKVRKEEEEKIQFIYSVYDTGRNKTKRQDTTAAAAAQEEPDKRKRDYLSPYIPSDKPITREVAYTAREACLKALKDRLLEKANMIHNRLEEEVAALSKRKAAYERNQDQMDKEEEEDYIRYCNEAMFRMQILEQRLARHEDQAVRKYDEMKNRINSDPRLAHFF